MIVIYAVEGNLAYQQRARNHLAALDQAGHRFAIRDLTRAECLVLGPGGGQRLSDSVRFFHGPNLRTLNPTAAMYTRARAIRGAHLYPAIAPAPPRRYGLAGALYLAAVVESDCDIFLTNDNQLNNFPDITVEELPRS